MGIVEFATDLGFVEGPVWDDEAATLSLVSISRGRVYTLDAEGRLVAEVETGGGPNGMARSARGLLVAQNGGIFGAPGPAAPGVQSIVDGAVEYVCRDGFAAPNDLAFGPDERLYITDPIEQRAIMEPVSGRVLACDFATGGIEVVIDDRPCPNGLAFTADGKYLLLAQTQAHLIERFVLRGRALVSEGVFCRLTNGRPDGMAIDMAGNLWVCTPGTGGIEQFAADGAFIRRIELGEGSMATNLCFGGAERRTLFITAAGRGAVLALTVAIPGLPLWRGPTSGAPGAADRDRG